MELWDYISWGAVALISISYWFQVWKIHKHREVRDLSLAYYVVFSFGICLLALQAYRESSVFFLAKQCLVILPVMVIIYQIIKHRQDTWHDDDDPSCLSCGKELEMHWKFCAYCGTKRAPLA